MDEFVEGIGLSPAGFDKLVSGDIDEFEPAELLLLRAMQSYEALDRGGATEEELERIYEWGEQTLMQQAMLNMVLKGEIYVVWDETEDDVAFRLAPGGMQTASNLGFEVPELPEI